MGLAVWRISSLLVQEDGPFYIFDRIRNKVGILWTEDSVPYSNNVIGQIFLCVWCMSVWISFAFFFLYLVFGQLFVWCCWPFALSALACAIQGVSNK